MAIYNDSFMNNATSFIDLVKGIGTSMGNDYLMGYLILSTFFVIFLIMSMKNDPVKIIIIDSFLTAVLGILFFITGLVPAIAIIIPVVILMITIVVYLFT